MNESRDSNVNVTYKIVSSSSFSSRHALLVQWSKPQITPSPIFVDYLSCKSNFRSIKIEMLSVSCPNTVQSEAFISTVALFMIFAASPKEGKAHLRLPSTWKDLWTELSHLQKNQQNKKDIETLRGLRDLISENVKPNSSMPGLEIQEPNAARALQLETRDLSKSPGLMEDLQADWRRTTSTPSYIAMLHSRKSLPIWSYKTEILESIAENQVTILCGETGVYILRILFCAKDRFTDLDM